MKDTIYVVISLYTPSDTLDLWFDNIEDAHNYAIFLEDKYETSEVFIKQINKGSKME